MANTDNTHRLFLNTSERLYATVDYELCYETALNPSGPFPLSEQIASVIRRQRVHQSSVVLLRCRILFDARFGALVKLCPDAKLHPKACSLSFKFTIHIKPNFKLWHKFQLKTKFSWSNPSVLLARNILDLQTTTNYSPRSGFSYSNLNLGTSPSPDNSSIVCFLRSNVFVIKWNLRATQDMKFHMRGLLSIRRKHRCNSSFSTPWNNSNGGFNAFRCRMNPGKILQHRSAKF